MTPSRLLPVAALMLALPALVAAQPQVTQAPPAPPAVPKHPRPPRAAMEKALGPEATEVVQRTFRLGPAGAVELSNLSGDVTVAGAAGEDVRMQATKRTWAETPEAAKARLAEVTIDTTESPGRVGIETRYQRHAEGRRHARVDVEYSLEVPYGTAVTLRSVAGSVKATRLKGDVRVESVSGDIHLESVARVARAKTVAGDVTIVNSGGAEMLDAATVSGRLMTKFLKARQLELSSVSGDVVLADTACERALVRSISGAVEFAGPLAKGGNYEFSSHAGDVRLKLAGQTGFSVNARSFAGQVRGEAPVVLLVTDKDPEGFPPGIPRNREYRALWGDGSAVVVVKTFSGSVVVAKSDGEKKE